MLERLGTDLVWATEYQDYVHQVSFAAPSELISFGPVHDDHTDGPSGVLRWGCEMAIAFTQ
jgi:hypothetical protein